jgi:hypothetical protein
MDVLNGNALPIHTSRVRAGRRMAIPGLTPFRHAINRRLAPWANTFRPYGAGSLPTRLPATDRTVRKYPCTLRGLTSPPPGAPGYVPQRSHVRGVRQAPRRGGGCAELDPRSTHGSRRVGLAWGDQPASDTEQPEAPAVGILSLLRYSASITRHLDLSPVGTEVVSPWREPWGPGGARHIKPRRGGTRLSGCPTGITPVPVHTMPSGPRLVKRSFASTRLFLRRVLQTLGLE